MVNKKRYMDDLGLPGEFVKLRGLNPNFRKRGDVLYEDLVTVVLRRDDVRALLLAFTVHESDARLQGCHQENPFDGSEYGREQADAAFDILTAATEDFEDDEA